MEAPYSWRCLATSAALFALSVAGTASPGDPLDPRTKARYGLDEAVEAAFERSPVVRALRAEVAEARGRRDAARTYPFNPEVGVGAARRRGQLVATTDYGISVSQEVEVAGQRGKRTRSAEAELQAAEAHLVREERLVAARVALAFSEAVRSRSLMEIERADAELAHQFAAFTQKRFEAGATSQIERNLGAVAAGRAERLQLLAEAGYRESQAALAEAIGLDAAVAVEPDELPGLEGTELLPLEELLENASGNRADLTAIQQMVLAAKERRELARAEAIPNLSLEGFVDREAGVDTIAGVGFSIGLPIFNRNMGRTAEARATVLRLEAERESLRLSVGRQVISAHARYSSALTSLKRLQEQVLGTLQENLALLERSFTAGKIGSLELLVFRREFVQSRRDHVAAVAEAWQARIALNLATGMVAVPTKTEGED